MLTESFPDMNLISGEGEHSRQGQLLRLRPGGRKESGMLWGCGEISYSWAWAGGEVLRSLAREEMEPNSKRFCKARSRIKSWI